MSGEAVHATGKRRSRAEVSRLVGEYLRSGLSLKAFCRQHHLGRSTLSRRLQQRQNLAAQPLQPSGSVPVGLAQDPVSVSLGAPSALAVVVAGGRRRAGGKGRRLNYRKNPRPVRDGVGLMLALDLLV